METANAILNQLGGNRFLVMTGAKSLSGSSDTLSFKVPGAKNGINYVTVTLDPNDTYSVKFYSFRGMKLTLKAETEMVYADSLREVFTNHTGLYTSL